MPLLCAIVAAGIVCSRQPTPIGELELAAAIRDAHGAVFQASPSPRRLAVAWAHVALECGSGRRAINWNFGNVGAAQKSPHYMLGGYSFAAYPDAVEGAQGYWRVIRQVCSGALRAFDDGDPSGAAKRLAACHYHETDARAYGAAMTSLYGHAVSRVLPKL